jgi:hypothetical protein
MSTGLGDTMAPPRESYDHSRRAPQMARKFPQKMSELISAIAKAVLEDAEAIQHCIHTVTKREPTRPPG